MGPTRDLLRALARGGDGILAVARAAVLRAGGALEVVPANARSAASFVLDLPLAENR
jgi:hypothetical protein